LDDFVILIQSIRSWTKHPHLVALQVEHAVEIATHAYGPGRRHSSHAQGSFDLIN
jgi:hypothetical protein